MSLPPGVAQTAGTPAEDRLPDAGKPGISGWNAYFIFKLLLLWRGLIDFHALENLAFFMLLVFPLGPLLRRVRLVLAVPMAVLLLYHDSFLPSPMRLFERAGAMTEFSVPYAIELLGRFVSVPVVTLMAGALFMLLLLRHVVRINMVVLVMLVGLVAVDLMGANGTGPTVLATNAADGAPAARASATPGPTRLAEGGSNAELNRILQSFYVTEARRVVRLPTPGNAELPFDLVFIHVCSLSWDDMEAAGLQLHPLWKSFDIVFRHFNAAATYSGPAAVRINRATCGQTSNDGLYAPVPERCYLMPSLKLAGFDLNFAMNHDGHFDDFLKLIRQQGLNVAPIPLTGVPVAMKGFDDSPIYDDGAVLTRWRTQRSISPAPRAALYYNTVTLHDGNRLVGAGSDMNSLQSYKFRLTRLFDEMEALMQTLATGPRRTVVVLIPEHGAAVRGDRFQVAGLREIPTPAITTVPVGIRVIDPSANTERDTAYVDRPSSFLALSQVIARMLEKSPFGPAPFDPQPYVADLPTTEFVAENQGVLMRVENRYFLREDREHWRALAFDNPP